MKKFDVVAVVGETKEGKPVWHKCGAVFETAKGLSLKLEAMPVGKDFDGWFKLFEPRQDDRQQEAPKPQQDQPAPGGGFNDEIPFAPRHWLT